MTEHQPHQPVDRNATIATFFPFHYGWIIVVAGLLSVIGGLGIGRFALGMLLPSMRTDLGLDYAQMGFIGTGNFIGYLLAVLASGTLVARLGARRVIFASLLAIGVTMMLISVSGNYYVLLLLYVITGMGSGATNVPMMGLVSHWFARRLRGRAAGFIVIGSGFGIMGSGLLIPAVNAHWGAGGWRVSWLILGLLVMVIALICGALLRNDPREVGSSRAPRRDLLPLRLHLRDLRDLHRHHAGAGSRLQRDRGRPVLVLGRLPEPLFRAAVRLAFRPRRASSRAHGRVRDACRCLPAGRPGVVRGIPLPVYSAVRDGGVEYPGDHGRDGG